MAELILPPKMSPVRGWIGVDWDGTLVTYDHWVGPDHHGEPVAPMVDLVKGWLAKGLDVRIFTARVWDDGTDERKSEARLARMSIAKKCVELFGQVLPITCTKDYGMVALYDDRCVRVEANTGRLLNDPPGKAK